ncbi:MAG: glycosyltransferase family 2 protein [Phycisphaerae bacterium]
MAEANPSAPAGRQDPSALISIVVPVHNESANIRPLAEAVAMALGPTPYELIFVDDSEDDTFAQIEALAAVDPRVRGLGLSRRFGHQNALSAGLRRARGRAVIMMDGDFQHPPELLPALIAKWREGFNVVQTVRQDAGRVPWLRRAAGRAFYRTFSALCGIPIEPGMADFRLIDRVVLDELNTLNEGQLFLRGLVAWMGYRRALVPFQSAPRRAGDTKYGSWRLLKFAKSGIFSFSSIPLRISIFVGLIMAALSLVELAFVIVAYFVEGRPQPGWTSTQAIMSFLFAVLFLLVGIQGEYIIRIYERVQRRPPFLIERQVGGDGTDTTKGPKDT